MLPLRVRVDLGVMAMKGYSTFPRALELEPHHQMQFNVMPRTPIFDSVDGVNLQLNLFCPLFLSIPHCLIFGYFWNYGSDLWHSLLKSGYCWNRLGNCVPWIFISTFFVLFISFGLMSTSLLLYSQHFGWCALWPFSGASCQTREPSCHDQEPSQNSLFNPQG